MPSFLQDEGAARWIYGANVELIRSADVVMANLDDFRGQASRTAGLPSRWARQWRSPRPYRNIGRRKRRSLSA
ncbi:Nucleoside 2-deoxyribosyltransferase (fragment) [Burkholderia sp. 8Y]|uniref:hypothetical protein n=1 Tax=Burkholderia sp. 8Y TaxID=2653133 RepID=UPI0012F440A5